jgi:hypothetical protein
MESSQKSPIDYAKTNEQRRLNDAREAGAPWKKWGPTSASGSGARSRRRRMLAMHRKSAQRLYTFQDLGDSAFSRGD